MRLVVQQPQFMAWIGYWAKLRAAERFVVYAGVKFDKGDHQHRVTLEDGLWVGAQVGDSERNKLIKDVTISSHLTLRKLAKTLSQKYSRSPYKARLDPLISLLGTWKGRFLLELDLEVQEKLCNQLHVKAEVLVDMTDRSHLHKIDKLKACIAEYASEPEYYMGRGGLNYMDFGSLTGIPVYVQTALMRSSPHSIVELIATEEHPERVVDLAYEWMDHMGDSHRIVKGVRV